MKAYLQIINHVWNQGHGTTVNRYVNGLTQGAGVKGWHYKCECGKEWSR